MTRNSTLCFRTRSVNNCSFRIHLILTGLLFIAGHFHVSAQTYTPDASGILYVKKGSSGTGVSWANAVGEVADALKDAKTNTAIKQIWVAGGTYKPLYSGRDDASLSNPRYKSFVLVRNVKMYGSFKGTEAALTDRDLSLSANQSILSGDIDDNDIVSGGIIGNNALHVVMAAGGGYCHLDGFAIQGGQSTASSTPMDVNGARADGISAAAIFADGVTLDVNACKIRGNVSNISNMIFSNYADVFVSNSEITGNFSSLGAAVGILYEGRAEYLNVTISGNNGDKMFSSVNPDLAINNCIIYGNTGSFGLAGTLSMNNNITQYTASGTNLNADPQFVNMPAASTAPFLGGNYQLQQGSPAINTGNNTFIKTLASDGIAANTLANVLKSGSCTGVNCTVSNLLTTTDHSSYTDYALLSLPDAAPGGAQASASMNVGWSTSTIKAGEFVGFVIATENISIQNPSLLGNIYIRLVESGGGTQTSPAMTKVSTTTLNGETVSYVGVTSPVDAESVGILLFQIPGQVTRLRVLSAFKLDLSTPRYNNTYDIIGKNRILNSAGGGIVDRGAYEVQVQSQTITVSDITRTYGEAAFAPGATATSGLAVNYSSGNTAIAEPFFDAADGKYKLNIKAAGTVTITASQPGNASWSAAASKTFQLTVNPKTVTVSLKSSAVITKVYNKQAQSNLNSDNLELASGDIVNSDDVKPVFNGILVYDDPNVGANKTATINYVALELQGSKAGNYVIGNTADITTNTASITPANINVQPSLLLAKTYGGADPALTYTYTGLFSGDAITGELGRETGEDAGTYNFLTGTLSAGTNYNITLLPAQFTINKKTVTVNVRSAAVITKQYDGNDIGSIADTDFEFAAGDIINNDELTITLNGTLEYDNKNAGSNKTVSLDPADLQLGGAKAGNYTIGNSTTLSFGNASITKATVTVTPDNGQGKVYGNTDPSLTFTFSGLATGDAITGAPGREGGEDVGNYNFTSGSLSAGPNYDLTLNSAVFTISQKNVTLGFKPATSITKQYDSNDDANVQSSDLEFGVGNIIGNDVVSISLSANAATYDNPNAGTGKTITLPVSSLSLTGAKAGNYNVSNVAALSINNAGITEAPLTITAAAVNKKYGENDPSLTYTLTNGQLYGMDALTGNLSRTAGSDVGVYPILLNTVSAGTNYTITYVGNNLTIGKAAQAITWTQGDFVIGCNGAPAPITLTASSNSGLTVTYVVTNLAIASVAGNTLTPVAGGATTITAIQAGDNNHEPATAVVKNFNYQVAGAIRQHWADAIFFDNSGGNYTAWQWYKNGNAINGATSPYYSESAALSGNFHVMATDKNGNTVEACPVTAAGATLAAGIKVSPNPVKAGSTATVTCNYNTANLVGAKLILSLVTGTKVQEITQVNATNQVTMPAQNGLYVLTLILANGQKASVNVLVK